jgi:subtilisin family serine protease
MRYIQQNLKEFEICGILKWHQKGYTGKGIKIAEIEGANCTLSIFDGKLQDPLNCGIGEGINGHGQKVLDIMHQVAPDADLYILPYELQSGNGYAKGRFIDETIPYAEQNRIDIIGASLGGTDNDVLNKRILEAQKNGIIFVTSAGNIGIRGLTGFAKSNVWIAVGACGYSDRMKEIFLKSYSSRGEQLDFCMFSGLYVYNAKDTTLKTVMQMEGTSFSSPMMIGMIALVQQFFLEKTGRKLTQPEMYKFICDHVKDLGKLGRDVEYGYGLFVLPNPESININKYIGGDNMFADIDKVSAWAKNSVIKVETLGLMNGDNLGNFNPKNPITREEFAVVIDRLLQYLNK